MVDGLACGCAVVDADVEVLDSIQGSQPCSDLGHKAEQGLQLTAGKVEDARDVPERNDQRVPFSNGVGIQEGNPNIVPHQDSVGGQVAEWAVGIHGAAAAERAVDVA